MPSIYGAISILTGAGGTMGTFNDSYFGMNKTS
jgi:hypothetical protein